MFCPECGTEIKEDGKFCPKCGLNLNESEKTENTSNNSTNIKTKSKGLLSFLDDWNDWGTGKKIGSIILVCCIGLIIIGAIGGILFPDLTTSEHRCYMSDSSFVLPDGYTLSRDAGGSDGYIITLAKDNGGEVFVNDYYPPRFDSSHIIDINETYDVDGVKVNKIQYHFNDGLSFTHYYFNKDNIDYCIVFNQETGIDENMVNSIVKTMDTTHGSIKDHENEYPNSSSDKDNGLYDSYTGGSDGEVNNVEVDKMELTPQQYAYLAYDGTKDYTINGHKGLLYVGPYHDGGSDVEFFYQDGDKYYMLSACDDSDKVLEKMKQMV